MRILFHSDSIFGRGSYGLSRYSRELWSALRGADPSIELSAYALRGQRYANVDGRSRSPDAAPRDFAGVTRSRWAGRIEMAAWSVLGWPHIERDLRGVRLVHSVELDYPVATRRPWVVTVHDLGPLTHPEYFAQSKPWLRRRALQQAVRGAAAIVSVSQTTAQAIENLAGRSLGARLHVVPEGVDDAFFERADPQCLSGLRGLPPPDTPYFLWTGSLNPRKNLQNVVRAFEHTADRLPHHLVLAGGLGWGHGEVLAKLEASPVRARIHRPGYVSDAQLRALYQGAAAFLYVSRMEGFGLPILEAMAGQCPVITSDCSSMPEIAGDAALLVDPTDPEQIADAMLQVAANRELRSHLICRGVRRAGEFTWKRCAERTLEVYRRVT